MENYPQPSKILERKKKISKINLDTTNPNQTLGAREKEPKTFHKLDLALGKSEIKCQNILESSQNIKKMDNFIRKDIHNPKLKFRGVTSTLQRPQPP